MRLEDLPPEYQAQARAQLAAAATRLGLKRTGSPLESRTSAPRSENGELTPTAQFPAKKRENRHRAKIGRGPNETEADFNCRFLDGRGLYEALTFRLPGGSRYTPDWILFDPAGGGVTCYEVKGSYRLPSEGRALTAFREARAAFPLVRFRWYQRDAGGAWEERHKI